MSRRFFASWRKGRIIGAVLAALTLLAGCSALKLGYGQLPTLAYWWLDGYVDFDAAQGRRVREELQRWQEWHRRTQLPAYAAHLARVRDEASRAVSGAQVCRFSDETRALLEAAVEPALPAAAQIVATLTTVQLEQIDARYRERTAELREEMLPADPRQRLQASVRRAAKRFESFYGDLTATQRQLLEDALRESPFDAEDWFAQRDRRHREMLGVARAIGSGRSPDTQAEQQLRQLLRRYAGRAPLSSTQRSAAVTAYNCELIARLHNSATAEQRQHFADKLAGWESDLRALVPQDLAPAGRAAAWQARP